MFIRNCWYVAAWSHELDKEGLISRSIINESVVLYRTQDGGLVGLEDRCCHRFAPLSKGQREGDDLRCMYHGLKFNRSGVCIEIPGQDSIPAKARVKTYPVVEKHSWIWIWMGDAALADVSLIPPAVGFDDSQWTLRCGQMDYQANYLLINDNLTDFSHLSYVHRNSFGATEVFARTRPTITRLERGIRVQRWIIDGTDPDRTALAAVRGRGPDQAHWQSYDYLVPGILLMRSEIHSIDSVPPDHSPPTAIPLSATFTSQAVTPMTDRTSRYFYSWGPQCGEGSDALADVMLGVANMAFTEDREMIEAQQQVIDRNPGGKELLTTADVGPVQMRNIIDRMIQTEKKIAEATAA